MTEENKELLKKDLCARLPYGIKARVVHRTQDDTYISVDKVTPMLISTKYDENIEDIKPFLRSMGRMTMDELEQLLQLHLKAATSAKTHQFNSILEDNETLSFDETYSIVTDFFNTHHLDHRGLINKGIALEAPDGMYEI